MSKPPPSPTRRRRWLRITIGIVAVLLIGLTTIGVSLDHFGQTERARPAHAIVVLGSRLTPDGRPGDSLEARVRKGVALYQQGLAPEMIFTGGVEEDGYTTESESQVASAYAQRLGVPQTAIFIETRSKSTQQNAQFAAEICRAHGYTDIIVVSDPYHLWRARFLFAREGITAYPSPALDCVRNRVPHLRILWAARETLLVIRDVAASETGIAK